MPDRTIHCGICNAPITGYDFPERMKKLREHRQKYHPATFAKSVKKGVETRTDRHLTMGDIECSIVLSKKPHRS